MTRRDWWIGIAVLAAALLAHALFPRYEWRRIGQSNVVLRIDTWRGRTMVIRPTEIFPPAPTP
jgi:hypothetical protein